MTIFFSRYPYFGGCLLGVFFFGLVVVFFRSQRRAILLSGALAVPQALFAIFLVPKYWHPKLVAVSAVGLEDVIFMFLCGGMAWVEACWPFRGRLALHVRAPIVLARWAGGVAFAVAAFLALLAAGLRGMLVPVIIMAAWIAVLLVRRTGLWPLTAAAAVQSLVLYAFTLAMMKVIWPGFFSAWTWTNLSGAGVGGVPVEEIAWGLAYGPFWGTTMAYVLGVEWKAPREGRASTFAAWGKDAGGRRAGRAPVPRDDRV